MNNKTLGIITAAIMILAGTIDSSSDKEKEAEVYCELVRLNDYDAAHGVPPLDRAGRPNYKQIDCYDDEGEDELRRLGLTSSR